MKLLIERINDVQYSLEEKEGQKPSMFIEGIYLQSEVKNKNGRIYPKGVMEEAVGKYINEKVKTGVAYGELSHPSGPNINPDRVCHRITELRWDGNNVIGKSKVGGPLGESVIKLMELGGKVGVSSRGLGSLKTNKDGIMEVQNDYKIATAADVVLDPSAPDAFVKGIMEDTEWIYDITKGIWTQSKAEQVSEEVRKMSKRELNEAKVRIFEHFLESIARKK
jgi:hypothetical protein